MLLVELVIDTTLVVPTEHQELQTQEMVVVVQAQVQAGLVKSVEMAVQV